MDLTRQSSIVITSASAQGSRPYQEDRFAVHHVAVPDLPNGAGDLLAVFDGHGGDVVSAMGQALLAEAFFGALHAQNGDLEATLRDTIGRLVERTEHQKAGATVSLVYIPKEAKTVAYAVLGDSPIAILDGMGALHLGPDHNVRTNLEERAAALKRGGIYKKGYLQDPAYPDTGLQMARTLGDVVLSHVLNRNPDVGIVDLRGKGIVLVATDGLIKPDSEPPPQQLARTMRLAAEGADANALVQDAVLRRTGDNVTVVLWKKLSA